MNSRTRIGCNAFRLKPEDTSPEQLAYQERFAALMDFATLPFYWGAYEREPGVTDETRVRAMAEWCRGHGILTKGYPLCWHEVAPEWHKDKTPDEMWELQLGRIRRDVGAFSGLVDTWDVVNEAVVMPDYGRKPNHMTPLVQRDGVVSVLKQAFAAAREANPDATLLINDYDRSGKYEQLIADCLDAGVDIDVIGIQSHMHTGYAGDEEIHDACERFARFGKPLHWTEATLISGEIRPDMSFSEPGAPWPTTPEGEERQVREVESFYRVLLAHPAVEAITWWDFTDGCWLNAPSGLVREDMSPKPAYERLLELVSQLRGLS